MASCSAICRGPSSRPRRGCARRWRTASSRQPRPRHGGPAQGGGALREPLEHPGAGLERERDGDRHRLPAWQTTATPTTPAHFADQLEMYDALTTRPGQASPATSTALQVQDFTPATVVSTKSPKPGRRSRATPSGSVHRRRPPSTTSSTGAGLAAIEDRMFLMDVRRHFGAARMAEFVGNTPGNVATDQAPLRSAYYTPAEANARSRGRPPTPAPRVRSASATSTRSSPASTRRSTTCARSSPLPPAPWTPRAPAVRPIGPAPTSSTSPRSSADLRPGRRPRDPEREVVAGAQGKVRQAAGAEDLRRPP